MSAVTQRTLSTALASAEIDRLGFSSGVLDWRKGSFSPVTSITTRLGLAFATRTSPVIKSFFPANCTKQVYSSYIDRWSGIDDLGNKHKEPEIMHFGYNGFIGVLVLAGDIWAILNIFQSSVSNEKKLIWIIAVVLLPVLGLLLWFFLGPRNGRSS